MKTFSSIGRVSLWHNDHPIALFEYLLHQPTYLGEIGIGLQGVGIVPI